MLLFHRWKSIKQGKGDFIETDEALYVLHEVQAELVLVWESGHLHGYRESH